MEQVIYEVLTSFLEVTKTQDVFCVAMHRLHVNLLQEALKDRKLILSFFENRYSITAHPEGMGIITQADYLVIDSQKNVYKMQKESGRQIENIMVIPPYDSRIDIGISQQLDVQKILVPIDDITDEKFGTRNMIENGRYWSILEGSWRRSVWRKNGQ